MNNIVLVTAWVRAYSPDRPVRQNKFSWWKPAPFEFHFDHNGFDGLQVIIEVPLTKEFIFNFDKITAVVLTGGNEPDPILTLAGWRYIQDAIDAMTKDEDSFDKPIGTNIDSDEKFPEDSNWHDDEKFDE